MDPRSVLARPALFDAWQRVIGAQHAKRSFMERYVIPLRPRQVVELGCGTGALCRYLPDGYRYIGIDISAEYVDAARAAFPSRSFLVGDVGMPHTVSHALGEVDLVVCFGVLHHLDDVTATRAIRGAATLLGERGSFLSAEPCHYLGEHRAERLLKQLDRGKYVRHSEHYKALVEDVFYPVQANIEATWMTVRYGLSVIAGCRAEASTAEANKSAG